MFHLSSAVTIDISRSNVAKVAALTLCLPLPAKKSAVCQQCL